MVHELLGLGVLGYSDPLGLGVHDCLLLGLVVVAFPIAFCLVVVALYSVSWFFMVFHCFSWLFMVLSCFFIVFSCFFKEQDFKELNFKELDLKELDLKELDFKELDLKELDFKELDIH